MKETNLPTLSQMGVAVTRASSMEVVNPAVAAAAESARARIQAAYLVAMHQKRNTDESRDRILRACRRPAFAERVEYSKPVGGRSIKGPSVRFAEAALREWGNILTETQVVYEDDNVRRIKLFVCDLESNATHSKEISISKTVERSNSQEREVVGQRLNTTGKIVYIVKATDDEIHNKEASAISKALRNEGLRLIPSDIIDEGIDTARATMRNKDSQDPETAKKNILDRFSEIGVRPKDIQDYLQHSTDTMNPAELEDLRGIYRAIRDGEARWTEYLDVDRSSGEKGKKLRDKLSGKKKEEQSTPTPPPQAQTETGAPPDEEPQLPLK